MNFLGHIFLSGEEEEIILGNFIADSVKGRKKLEYAPGVVKGIQLHRAIDSFTDHHPIVVQGVRRLNKDFGHYGTVIIDMYNDHFLASLWRDYHQVPLERFSLEIYAMLLPHLPMMPERTQRMLPYMIQGNWLTAYAGMDGLRRALKGMASRAKFESGMEGATDFLINHYEEYKAEFKLFMPDIMAYCDDWRKVNLK